VILAHTTPVAAALQREIHTIPIVFVNVSDPIGSGFIASLARPGGNITGVLHYEASIVGKWLGFLKDIAPNLTRIGLLGNPNTTPFDYFLRSAQSVAGSLSLEVIPNRVDNSAANIERTLRGVQYACGDYIGRLEVHGVQPSMSKAVVPMTTRWPRAS
jgi:putative ABC transport system substrate-binding protein